MSLGLPECLKYFSEVLKACQTFWRFFNFRKCLGPSGTPGVCWKSYKNIYKLARHSEASTTSEKCLGPSGTPGVC